MNSIPVARRKSGFTLIELLVVIAIIAILAAILFPVFARARENARRASCQSNERNIALGFKQYIQDNGEKYPANVAGADELKGFAANTQGLEPYIKSTAIFFCPSDSNKTGVSYGYLLNGENESAIDNTTTRELISETSKRHFDGQNIAYVDGHVKWTKGGTLSSLVNPATLSAAFGVGALRMSNGNTAPPGSDGIHGKQYGPFDSATCSPGPCAAGWNGRHYDPTYGNAIYYITIPVTNNGVVPATLSAKLGTLDAKYTTVDEEQSSATVSPVIPVGGTLYAKWGNAVSGWAPHPTTSAGTLGPSTAPDHYIISLTLTPSPGIASTKTFKFSLDP